MGLDDNEPEPAPGSNSDIAQEIQDSFQAVLDALDAARANLYAADEQQTGADLSPPSWDQYSEPVAPAPVVPEPVAPAPVVPEPVAPAPVVPEPVVRAPVAPAPVVPEPVEPEPVEPEPVLVHPAHPAYPTHPTPPVALPPPATQRPVPHADQLAAPPSTSSPPSAQAHATRKSRGWLRFTDRREARLVGVFGVGAASGLILASSLMVNDSLMPGVPSPPPRQVGSPAPDVPDSPLPEIPGTGVLRQGDSGHGVYELQVRLLQVPNVYDGGAIDGRYGTELRAAVARFQEWYGIRGDETGVYGDNTRHALMLRTK
jgi:hypothetical protein